MSDKVMSVVHFGSFLPITTMILKATPQNKATETNKASAVKNFAQLRRVLNSNARLLILDLEFYQDQQNNRHGVAQIAGKMFNQYSSFNYYLYGRNMSTDRQLAFLKQYDLRFSEVETYQTAAIFQRIFQFIRNEQPDYIVSWDNSTDFGILNREANQLHIPKDQRPWRTIRPLDLEKLVAKEVWKNKSGISLEKMCKLLHLPPVKYHQAENDVKAIEQVLRFYALDLGRELLC